jgi:hypothetical protein
MMTVEKIEALLREEMRFRIDHAQQSKVLLPLAWLYVRIAVRWNQFAESWNRAVNVEQWRYRIRHD